MLPLLYFGFSVPNDSYDLSRYYVMIEHMQGMQLHDLFNTESTWSSYISGTEYVSFLKWNKRTTSVCIWGDSLYFALFSCI